jgi:hypothetical protein
MRIGEEDMMRDSAGTGSQRTQVRATHDRLRKMSSEISVIHRRVERLEELGASNAGFAKEIDHLLTRVAEIEKHLGIDKKMELSRRMLKRERRRCSP